MPALDIHLQSLPFAALVALNYRLGQDAAKEHTPLDPALDLSAEEIGLRRNEPMRQAVERAVIKNFEDGLDELGAHRWAWSRKHLRDEKGERPHLREHFARYHFLGDDADTYQGAARLNQLKHIVGLLDEEELLKVLDAQACLRYR